MGAALSKTCDALGLTGRNDPITTLVAEKIIELAERGLRSPTAIHSMAMTELKSNSHLTGPLVRDCHQRAAETKANADVTNDPALKAEFLDMESRRLTL